MPRFKDRTGDKYGRLTVLSHAGKDHRNKHLWLCMCDCGNKKVVASDNLSSGKSNSCGCLKAEFLARKVIPQKIAFLVASFAIQQNTQ